jgi:hypothetical protein
MGGRQDDTARIAWHGNGMASRGRWACIDICSGAARRLAWLDMAYGVTGLLSGEWRRKFGYVIVLSSLVSLGITNRSLTPRGAFLLSDLSRR